MNSTNESRFNHNFSSSHSPSMYRVEPASRSTSSTRSVPRLVKLRKHGSNRGRSGRSVLDDKVASDFNNFNPFCREEGSGSVRVNDDTRFRDLFDKYGTSVNNDFVNLNSQKCDFDGELRSVVADEMRNLKIGSKDVKFNTVNKKNVFVFGSSDSKVDSRLNEGVDSALPDQMKKLNIESNGVFGRSGSLDKSVDSVLRDQMKKLNIESTIVFGRSESLDSKLPEEMKNLKLKENGIDNVGVDFKVYDEMRNFNIKDTGNGDGNGNGVKLESKGSNDNGFVFGSSGSATSVLHNEMKKMNINDSRVGEKVEESKNENVFVFGSSKKDSTIGVLPDEMSKLNMGSENENPGVFLGKTSSTSFSAQPNVSTDKMFNDAGVSNSMCRSFAFEATKPSTLNMTKLNMGSKNENPTVFPGTTSYTSFSAQPKVSTDKILDDAGLGNSMRGSLAFKTTNPSRSSSVGSDQSVQPSDGSKSSGTSTSFAFQGTKPNRSSSVVSDHSVQPNDGSKSSGASSSYTFYSADVSFQLPENIDEEPSVDIAGNVADFAFGTPHMDFKTVKLDASCSSAANIFAGLNQKLEFSAKKGAVKESKSKKKRGKARHPATVLQSSRQYDISGQSNISSENLFRDNAESSGCYSYSPMDVSPYQETFAADKSSRGASVASDESIQMNTDRLAGDAHSSAFAGVTDEDLVTVTESLNISEDGAKFEELREGSMDNFGKNVGGYEFVSSVESEYLRCKTEMEARSRADVAAERDTDVHSCVDSKENDGRSEFCFASNSENASDTNFTFAASTSAQRHTSAVKRHYKKKTRSNSGTDSNNCSLNAKLQFAYSEVPFFPLPGHSSHPVTEPNRQGDPSLSQFMGENTAVVNEEPNVKQGSISRNTATAGTHEACEKWRIRGNQAYANGDLSKAEDYYTRGLKSVPKGDTSEDCLTALTLCYSNRAAARMSSGRMRAALEDCKKAVEMKSDFHKVQVRAANCHLALGEIEEALQYFKNALPQGAGLYLDRKIVIQASNGLQNAQKAGVYLDRCGELLRQRTSNDAESALQIITKALIISPYSEKLVEMKAEALLTLRKYEEMIQLCEESLGSADKNSSSVRADGSESIKNFPARLWRWQLMAKSYFYLGRLEETLSFLEKLEQAKPIAKKYGSKMQDSLSTLAVTVHELLRHKAAGNEAFQSGRHSEAVEHYTSALSCNLESRPFAAICFCNRAAAHQALGQITDAIADCSLAIALDGNYPKAISRRATLHEMIRDYSQAAVDIGRFIAFLEKQTEEKSSQSGKLGRSTSGIIDLRQAQSRLSTVEEDAKKGTSLDFYLILGIESTCVATEIKKAYRKAALRHHPDKAAQVLPRNENGDDGVWKEIAEEVYKDADRLFKMIGEAYAVLSDPVKRFQYDEEERHAKKGNGCSTSSTPSDAYHSHFERSTSRRQWQDVRRSYRGQYAPWSDASQSNRYY